MDEQTIIEWFLSLIFKILECLGLMETKLSKKEKDNMRRKEIPVDIESDERFERRMAMRNQQNNVFRGANVSNISFMEPIKLEKEIIQLIEEQDVDTSSYVKRDFSELLIVKKGVRPKQLSATLKVYIEKYKDGSDQHLALRSLINELDTAGGDDCEDLCGRSKIEQVAAAQENGELTATFIIYQFRRDPHENKLLVDALLISGTQRLSVDWMELVVEAGLGVLPFLINPAVGAIEIIPLIGGGFHLLGNAAKIKSATTDRNAKALLFKMLIDKGIAKIEDEKILFNVGLSKRDCYYV